MWNKKALVSMGSFSRSCLVWWRVHSPGFSDGMGMVISNFGFITWRMCIQTMASRTGTSSGFFRHHRKWGRCWAPWILLVPGAVAPSYHKPRFLDQVKDCSTHVHVKMWILIVKTVFCKYINLSAYNLVQIYTHMIYTDVICTTEQHQFKKHLLFGMNPSFL